MPIKKRSAIPQPDAPSDKLVITPGIKKPIPEAGKIRDVYGTDASPAAIRGLGPLAIDCGDARPDERLTIEDRVTLVRTSYDPKNTPAEPRYRNRVRNRGTAITAMCIVCTGTRKNVTECADTTCPLWPFRFGSDPFYGKSKK